MKSRLTFLGSGKVILIILLTIFTTAANATDYLSPLDPVKKELYKCRDRDGKYIYTDVVCPKGMRSTSKGWISVEQEEKEKRLEKERELAQKESLRKAEISAPKTNIDQTYYQLPESSRWYNPNTDRNCFNLVQRIRTLENRPDFNSNRNVGREWSAKGDLAMKMGCKW